MIFHNGNLGYGLRLASGSAHYVSVPYAARYHYQYNDAFSFSTWLIVPTGTERKAIFWGYGGTGMGTVGWSWEFVNATALRFLHAVNGGGGSNIDLGFNYTYTAGQALHVMLVKAPGLGASFYRAWVNGVELTRTVTVNNSSGTITYSSASPILMGAVRAAGGMINYSNLTYLSHQVYNRALTDAEVAFLYRTPGAVVTGAVLNLAFDHKQGTLAADLSGNGDHGTLNNFSPAQTSLGASNAWLDSYTLSPLLA